MSDPELGVNIGTQDSAHQMIMYQERFGQCIEYAFEETPSVDEVAFPLRTEDKLEEEDDPLFPNLRSKTSSASSFMTNDRITIHKGIKN